MKKTRPLKIARQSFVVCIRCDGYEGSLDIGKIYVVLPDRAASKYGRVRIVDNEGEDYLYPVEYFMPVQLSKSAQQAVAASAA